MSTDTTRTPIAGQAFELFLDEQLQSPEDRAEFERRLAKVKNTAEVMHIIEQARKEAGLAKAEVARRMGRKPSAVSRLLSGNGANPTLDTLGPCRRSWSRSGRQVQASARSAGPRLLAAQSSRCRLVRCDSEPLAGARLFASVDLG